MIEYLNRETVMKELDRNSIVKKITLSDGVSIYDSIQKLPTADVVEVVRCKDCVHGREITAVGKYYCAHRNGLIGCLNGTEYCSYGARREK